MWKKKKHSQVRDPTIFLTWKGEDFFLKKVDICIKHIWNCTHTLQKTYCSWQPLWQQIADARISEGHTNGANYNVFWYMRKFRHQPEVLKIPWEGRRNQTRTQRKEKTYIGRAVKNGVQAYRSLPSRKEKTESLSSYTHAWLVVLLQHATGQNLNCLTRSEWYQSHRSPGSWQPK